VKILANIGAALRKKDMYVFAHEGSLGWRRAQDRAWIEGCAGEVIAARLERDEGSVWVVEGKRIGETKEG